MLRRIQPVSVATDSEAPGTAAPEEPAAAPFVERRRTDRRGMDALRAEALQSLMSRVEDKNFGGLRSEVQWNRAPKPKARLVLFAVALLAGGLAAFLALQRGPAPEPVAAPAEALIEYVPEARTKILVATQAIGVGQRLTAAAVGWEDWPEASLVPEYITIATEPEAVSAVEGQVARTDFVPGEPIRPQKLAPAGQGFLSAVLGSGKRAVSVVVAAESASGGFIVPGDRVDVILTRTAERGQVSDTILHGVRVMAINGQLDATVSEETPAQPEVFGGQAIATLELDPAQGEVIINAATMGKLSLVLRATQDAAAPDDRRAFTANQAIRLSSPFWTN